MSDEKIDISVEQIDKAGWVGNYDYPADVANWYEGLSDDERKSFLSKAPVSELARLIEHLYQSGLDFTIENLSKSKRKQLLNVLDDDILTDLLQSREEPEDSQELIELLGKERQAIAKDLLKYPENSAGGRMTTQIVKLRENLGVGEALKFLIGKKEQTELLARIYVIDKKNRIVGKLRLRDLAFAKRSEKLGNIMQPIAIAISAYASQEEAARLIEKYDLYALPVINSSNEILGVITYDVAMEIMRHEATEDIEKSAAIVGPKDDLQYLETPVLQQIKRRIFWIISLAFASILSGLVIYKYEDILGNCFLLAIYMPMVVAAGGNTGGQAAVMVIRAMSLGEFDAKDLLKVFWKEFRIGVIIGLILAIIIVIQIMVYPVNSKNGDIDIWLFALTVGLGLLAQVSASTVIGGLLPIFAKLLKLDPAAVASPMITTIVDIIGLVIYFSLAKTILGLP